MRGPASDDEEDDDDADNVFFLPTTAFDSNLIGNLADADSSCFGCGCCCCLVGGENDESRDDDEDADEYFADLSAFFLFNSTRDCCCCCFCCLLTDSFRPLAVSSGSGFLAGTVDEADDDERELLVDVELDLGLCCLAAGDGDSGRVNGVDVESSREAVNGSLPVGSAK